VNNARGPLSAAHTVPTVVDVTSPLDWQRGARCRGDAGLDFYPPFGGERKRDRVVRELRAKAVCESCPVRVQCLDHAVRNGERYGVWGGLTSDERLTYRQSA
jgi:WhiB family transcriptional regulator, redox-sensing transcriptional regulator